MTPYAGHVSPVIARKNSGDKIAAGASPSSKTLICPGSVRTVRRGAGDKIQVQVDDTQSDFHVSGIGFDKYSDNWAPSGMNEP